MSDMPIDSIKARGGEHGGLVAVRPPKSGGRFLLVARLLLGLMFIWMGLAKTGLPRLADARGWVSLQGLAHRGLIDLSGPVEFMKLIREYQIFPDSLWPLLNLTAVALPWVEVVCGLLLVLGIGLRGSALTLGLMLIFFTVVVTLRAIGIHNATGQAFCTIKFDCGCGAGEVLICRKIPENLGLLALSVVVLFSRSKRFCLAHNLVPADRARYAVSSKQ